MTRYVWFEMLLVMHEAEPYGHLLIAGRAPEATTLARVIGVDAGDVKRAVRELSERGVLSRTEAGVICSRRMIRDENRRKSATNNGAKGGNPSLKNHRDRPFPVNPPDKGGDKAHIPEARNQNPRSSPHSPPRGAGGGVRGSMASAGLRLEVQARAEAEAEQRQHEGAGDVQTKRA